MLGLVLDLVSAGLFNVTCNSSSMFLFAYYGRPLVTQNNHYLLRMEFFFQTLFLRRLRTDFLDTLPHDVGWKAIENVPSTFS